MGRKKSNAPVGLGRLAPSLGASDPRRYRNAQQQQSPQINLDKTMRVDRRGRQGVTPARGIANLPPDATLEDVAAKLQELIQTQRDAGQMEGGR